MCHSTVSPEPVKSSTRFSPMFSLTPCSRVSGSSSKALRKVDKMQELRQTFDLAYFLHTSRHFVDDSILEKAKVVVQLEKSGLTGIEFLKCS